MKQIFCELGMWPDVSLSNLVSNHEMEIHSLTLVKLTT